MIQQTVTIAAEHPVAGLLYLEIIPDSQVGFADIYQLTDSLCCADFLDIRQSGWRERGPAYNGQPWDEWVLNEHLSRIDWLSNKAIQRICRKHNLSCPEFRRWAEEVTRWQDMPVMTRWDGDEFIATHLPRQAVRESNQSNAK